jgi:hypothetical protein
LSSYKIKTGEIMKIKKEVLLNSMKHCLPGVEKGNSLIEGADTFVFGAGAIHSYNDGISVSAPFDVGDLTGAVKSMDFYKFINKIPGDEVEITPAEGEWNFKTETMEASMTLVNSKIIDYISQLSIKDLGWLPLPDDFFEGVRLCKISCNRSIQRGIYVQNNRILSTDTIRINAYIMNKEMPNFWLDDPAITELVKVPDLKQYSIQPAWVHFKNEQGVVFSCKRKADGQYPHDLLIKHIQNNSFKKETDSVYHFPPSITDVVDRVGVLADTIQDSLAIQMIIGKNNIIIQSKRESGKIKETIAFEKPLDGLGENQTIEMWVEPDFIIEASKKVTGFIIKQHEKEGVIQKNLVFFNDKYCQVVAAYADN